MGLRDPSHASKVMVVAELAHYASLPPQDVERMLDDGEVPVLSNLDRSEAERAAYELNELGAVVDLRLAHTVSGVFPVLKPDADRQVGVAVGGLIDDSATPPSVGESRGLPELEPDPEAPRRPRPRAATPNPGDGMSLALGSGVNRMQSAPHRPAITRGRGPEPIGASPHIEPAPRNELLTDRGPPGIGEEPLPSAGGRGDVGPGQYGVHRPEGRGRGQRTRSAGPRPGGAGRRPGAKAKPKPQAKSPPKGKPKAKGKPRAKPKPKPRPKPKPKPKSDELPSDVSDLLGDIGSGPPPAQEPARLPDRLKQATESAKSAQGPLELDFEAAGMKRPTSSVDMPIASAGHQANRSASTMPRRTRAGNMGGTGASASAKERERGVIDTLRNDGVAGLILGLGVGLILSMALALSLQRGAVRDRLPPLEDELAESLSDPEGVEAGDLRSPAAIEGEINQALDEIERRFLLVWFAAGLPVGFLLSRLRSL